MTHQFRTTVKNVSCYNESVILECNKESDETISVDEIIVVWEIEFEVRERGVKSGIASVIDFEFNVYQDDYTDPDTNETIHGFEKGFTNDDSWKVEINTDNFTFDNMCLDCCDINFDTGEIELY